jgi:acyl-CoA thioesterase
VIDNGQPVEELRTAVESLSEERARTLLGWIRVMRRQQRTEPMPSPESTESLGPLGDLLGMVTERRGPGNSRLRLVVDAAWHNPNGVLHGGVIYTLIDSSMGGAVQPNLPEGEHCATIEVKVNYLSPVREGTLWAETTVVKQGRHIAFTESKVWDHNARLVATASGSMFLFRQEDDASAD